MDRISPRQAGLQLFGDGLSLEGYNVLKRARIAYHPANPIVAFDRFIPGMPLDMLAFFLVVLLCDLFLSRLSGDRSVL